MLEQLRHNWWVLVIRGTAAALFGLGSLLWPSLTLMALVTIFGAYAMVDGVFTIVGAIRHRHYVERWPLGLVQGLLGVGAGLAAWFLPTMTALLLVFVIAGWALATGSLEVLAAMRLRRVIEREWLLWLGGVASVALSLLLMVRPGAGALALTWLIGIYALLFGALKIALGLSMRNAGARVDVPGGPLPA